MARSRQGPRPEDPDPAPAAGPAAGPGPSAGDPRDARLAACSARYWRSNVAVMVVLLAVWALAGLGCGVLLADWLNGFRLGGFPLGFWFAQQGSILVFVLLILVYALVMSVLDWRHRRHLRRLQAGGERPGP